MSWIFGVYAMEGPFSVERWRYVQPSGAIDSFIGNRFGVCSGGFAKTRWCARDETGIVYAGVGIPMLRNASGVVATWSDQTIQSITSSGASIDGHYVLVKCTDSYVRIWNDRHGLRTLFLLKSENLIYFSTKLELLTPLNDANNLSVDAFSSYWKSFNQLSHDCLITGIDRLPPGGRITISSDGMHTTTEDRIQPGSDIDLRELLADFLRIPVPQSLGISGGVDSRFLLSQIIRNRLDIKLHVFGDERRRDAVVARRISSGVERPLRSVEPRALADDSIDLLRAYCLTTSVSTSASSAFKFSRYDVLEQDGLAAIDGSFGEFMRRQFVRRLRIDLLKSKVVSADRFISGLKAFRGDIFRDDFDEALDRSFRDIAKRMADEWQASTLSADDFVDRIAMQYKYPNFYCYGQTWIDGMALSWMPLGQPSFLDAVYSNTSVKERTGGKLVKQMIREDARRLTRYPFVKGEHTYPFNMDYRLAWLWTKVQSKVSNDPVRSDSAIVLSSMREWMFDLIHSKDVRTSQFVDAAKVRRLAEQFHEADDSTAGQLDWFIAFELWRQGVRL